MTRRIYDQERAGDPLAAVELADLMSEISETYYAAGWLCGLEFRLWDIAEGRTSPAFGFGAVSESEIQRLRDLSDRAGGWVVWCDDESGLPFGGDDPRQWGEAFLPMADWLVYRAKYRGEP